MAGTHALGGYLMAQTATFSVTAAQAETADAVLGTIYVPNNAVIHDVIVQCDNLDTGATFRLDVGDSAGPATADDNRFAAALNAAAGAVNYAAAASGNLLEDIVYEYVNSDAQVEQAIEATVNAVAATGLAGDLTMTVVYHAP